ncbi:hypothetical protein [Hyphobacterium sp.]|uniref:hypothetical protein n=1 Tax=Hyphobacterium sp. TaxID=2004662 RepID=UPI003BAC07FA
MTRFISSVIALLLFGVASAMAGAPPAEGESSVSSDINIDWNHEDTSADEAHANAMADLGVDDGHPRIVVMPAIVVPLVVENRLRGYAYIHSRLLVSEGENASDIIEQTHFALDRLIRASHRHNLTAESGDTIDIELTRDVWLQALAEYFGEDVIERLAIMPPDTRLIR